VEDASAALAGGDFAPSFREAAAALLEYYRFHARRIDASDADVGRAYSAAVEYLSWPAGTQLGMHQRLRLLLILRCVGEANGLDTLDLKSVNSALSALLSTEWDTLLWQGLSLWAFRHREAGLLARAYGIMYVRPSSVMGEAKRQRIRLMYLLAAGKAAKADVRQTIHSLAVLPQLREFVYQIWPVCQEAGLVDDELEQLLEKQRQAIIGDPASPQ
jgi:hypothetical protein